LVDDDPGAMQVMARILAAEGTIRFATNGEDALRIARADPPEVILLDAQMPVMNGFQLLVLLKEEPTLADVPVIFVTSHSETGFELYALESGAADFISKPYTSSVVLARVRTHLRIKRMADQLRRCTLTDSLTGLENQRQFDAALGREWLSARRAADPLSLVMVDIDHFKSYGARHGDSKADDYLCRLARVLESVCRRPCDRVARCGGDEFELLLPKTSRRGAAQIAHAVLQAVTKLGGCDADSPTSEPPLTVSIGIASYDEDSPCWEKLPYNIRCKATPIRNVDAECLVITAASALTLAKQAGGGQARLCEIPAAEPAPAALLAASA
jgi:diguanylate cyclase (GGDEF)-like protein